MNETNKILDKTYLTAKDIKELIPEISMDQARNIISQGIDKMKKKNLIVPRTKQKMALTKVVKEMMGI